MKSNSFLGNSSLGFFPEGRISFKEECFDCPRVSPENCDECHNMVSESDLGLVYHELNFDELDCEPEN